MQINLNSAIQSLRSTDRQIRAELGKPGKGSEDDDRVELGNTDRILSAGYVQLQTELSDKLASLTGLVGESAAQHKDLAGLFNDPKSEDAVRQRAQELLDGYFNVQNTGDRIFDFAFSHYKGGDREAFAEEFKGYIHKGFQEAEKLLGGLADISVETRDYIDGRIDDFINEGKEPEADAEAAETPEQVEAADEKAPGLSADVARRAFIPKV